ncbi:alpha-ketoglutarate-dependent dioxygenase AlkB family protein [Gillisia limnaea]|uniref:2OG-Fe(II) oxygenase n=1 Tax=Gillisia limnaea (strain DSM 15749 / LMG 21470 / R-8282) TaxID=865937 RepID=H2BRK8_GILLR|nr:alpha-ketoglutarate-dependent dioxygenase AlkB [Gillisia limnaea]EHQ04527.1 2OG-Fe(II) oxygenase [Gillisia limnaea DSM 15749]
MDLFSFEEFNLNLPNANVTYCAGFLEPNTADRYFQIFLKELNWQHHDITIFGKKIPQPRLTALYAINELPYSYSNLTLIPKKFTLELLEIQQKVNAHTGKDFTHCLVNLYRDGNDSMGWHSDDEKELGIDPVIASVSLGGVRSFQLKHKNIKDQRFKLDLEHGSLFLMAGSTQHFWKHQLPKTKKQVAPRINLTFRTIL